MRYLTRLIGATNGTTTTGTVSLALESATTAVTYFQIPLGTKAKIWVESVSGAPAVFQIQLTHNIASSSPVWVPLDVVTLPSPGDYRIMYRRPIVIRTYTDQEAIQVVWTQASAATSVIALGMELTDEDTEEVGE